MNHEEAINHQVAASYLLGDLSAEERDAFEEHYFDCRVCGDAVRAGAAMFATGREVVLNEAPVLRFRPWKWAASGAAAAALVMVVGFKPVIVPYVASLTAPPPMELLIPLDMVPSVTRGEAAREEVISFTGNKRYAIYREVVPEEQYSRYQFQLRNAAGKVLVTMDVPPKFVGSPDAVPMSLRPLPAGRYVLATLGVRKDGNRSEIDKLIVVVK